MLTSQNGRQLPSRRRDGPDLSGTIDSIIAACGAYLATRSIIIAVIIVVTAALLVIANLTR
jgi:hypothetical protein